MTAPMTISAAALREFVAGELEFAMRRSEILGGAPIPITFIVFAQKA
jgi:hypothetical protein